MGKKSVLDGSPMESPTELKTDEMEDARKTEKLKLRLIQEVLKMAQQIQGKHYYGEPVSQWKRNGERKIKNNYWKRKQKSWKQLCYLSWFQCGVQNQITGCIWNLGAESPVMDWLTSPEAAQKLVFWWLLKFTWLLLQYKCSLKFNCKIVRYSTFCLQRRIFRQGRTNNAIWIHCP